MSDHPRSAQPPQNPVMATYGSVWDDFIASFAPARALRYLPDAAPLEWLRPVALTRAMPNRWPPSASRPSWSRT